MTEPRDPAGSRWTDHRRRLTVAGVVAAAVAAPSAVVAWSPWAGTLPTVERGYSRCPTAPEPSIRAAPPPAGPLVPDVRYHSVQLCPGATSRTGERTASRTISNHTSAEIVARLNALPSTPPTAECSSRPTGTVVDLVLKGENPPVVVHLDIGPCGSVRRDGVIRYGAGELHRYAADLIGGEDG